MKSGSKMTTHISGPANRKERPIYLYRERVEGPNSCLHGAVSYPRRGAAQATRSYALGVDSPKYLKFAMLDAPNMMRACHFLFPSPSKHMAI